MDIVLIGSGNTASVIGRALFRSGNHIKQVFGRNELSVTALASELEAEPVLSEGRILTLGDLALILLPDKEIAPFASRFRFKGIVAHAAGSVPIAVLRPASARTGVFYPLQSLRKEIASPELTMLVDAPVPEDLEILEGLGRQIASRVIRARDADRRKYHLAAVIGNNFVNYLFAETEAFCRAEKLDFSLLLPLLKETTERMMWNSPARVQTGPAVRGDEATLSDHLDQLKEYPGLQDLYRILSEGIKVFYQDR